MAQPTAPGLPRRVLIANRGETARRIIRTCRAAGIATVAVHADADASAWHVSEADQAVRLDGRTAADAYRRIDALLDAAARTSSDAVHPGYGSLAEHAGFARAVADAGLLWVGPPPEVIAQMADKVVAKELMRQAGLPLVRSAELPDGADITDAGQRVGFPLLVKAAVGGGGKGMRLVRRSSDLREAVDAVRREAEGVFGDPTVFLERYVERARHLEVQLLGDAVGEVVHLFERECSVQRRHQKIIEESPSPALDAEVRGALLQSAVDAGILLDYRSAGTIEFVADERLLEARRAGREVAPMDCFAFLEMTPRLQAEHPVTERTVRVRRPSGVLEPVDLVLEQLRVAGGSPLTFTQDDLVQVGHAVEARLLAEDPAAGYLPCPGRLQVLTPAGEDEGIRWDRGVRSGDEVPADDDPMIAKVIAHAASRSEAVSRLGRALADAVLMGTPTNQDLLIEVLRHPSFVAGDTATDHLEVHHPRGGRRACSPAALEGAAMAVALALAHRPLQVLDAARPEVVPGSTSAATSDREVRLRVDGRELTVRYRSQRGGTVHCEVSGGGVRSGADGAGSHDAGVWDLQLHRLREATHAHLDGVEDSWLEIEVERVRTRVRVTSVDGHHLVVSPAARLLVEELPRLPRPGHTVPDGATPAPGLGTGASVGSPGDGPGPRWR